MAASIHTSVYFGPVHLGGLDEADFSTATTVAPPHFTP
jgi:hypothetical protein